MQIHPKLTTRDSANIQRFYWAESRAHDYRTASQKTTTGTVIYSQWTRPRKNERRTTEEQVQFEVGAIYRKRQRLGWDYIKSPRALDARRHYKPMLAQKYPKLRPNWQVPQFAQPKLDGVRCCATIDGLWTRKNISIQSVPHIRRLMENLFQARPDLIALDGELYVHGWPLHKISGLVRRAKHNTESLQLEYHIFDAEFKGEFETYQLREQYLTSIFARHVYKDDPIKRVETHRVYDEEDIDFLHKKWVKAGYEGSMYRNGEVEYMHKRTPYLLKRKDFQTAEFRVVNITEGNGAWTGVAKRIHYRLPDGTTFETGVRGTIPELTLVLKHKRKYIDKPATVRYLYLDKRSGIPQIPVTINLARDDI